MSNVIEIDRCRGRGVHIEVISNDRGPQGEKGDTGEGLRILDAYETYEELIAAHRIGKPGDAYIAAGKVYVWSSRDNAWQDTGILRGPQGEAGPQGPQGEPGINTWGSITGDIGDQTDLQEALDEKQNQLTSGRGIAIEDDEISTSAAIITMTNVDPGEGVPLEAGQFIAVYED